MKEDVREPVCVVTGPLGPLEAGIRAALGEEGFTPGSIRCVTDTMRRLSGWMEQRGMRADGLTPEAAEEFVADSGDMRTARRGLGALLRLLRSQAAIPPERDSAGDSAAGRLLAQYRDYLAGERGLAAESVRCYLVQGRKLVDELGDPLDESLARLDAAAVTSFIMRQSRQAASTWSAKTLVTAPRSLLRFLHVKGLITAPLAGAVPAVAGWRLSALPRGLGQDEVEAILAAPDPASRSGLRDRAILMLLARLGLRGAEAAGLQLADIDWQAGEITVTGKGSQTEAMPLPADAGQALADYLTKGRPRCSSPAVFVTARAPYHQITPSVVRALMPRACEQAGLPRAGAHRLRHSLATGVLRAGAPLSEVGQLLRHRSQLSTSIYARRHRDETPCSREGKQRNDRKPPAGPGVARPRGHHPAPLRVSELAGLTIADTHLGDGPHLRCHGKGRKERCTPLTPDAAKILRAWIRERGGQPEDPLFPSRRGTRLSRDAVARLVAVHAETAARSCPSIAGKHVTPHTLRHSTAMALLRAGVDTSVIALWLGHESPETTQAYLHADMEIKNRALARVNPPGGTPGRYSPPDSLIAYLKTL